MEDMELTHKGKEKHYFSKDINIGARLKLAREKANYSASDVAEKLNLTKKVIDYIESEKYEYIDENVFYRGYLRAYAKLLNVDINSIVKNAAPDLTNDTDVKVYEFDMSNLNYSSIFTRNVRWISFFIIFLVVLAIGIWWQIRENDDEFKIIHSKSPIISDKEKTFVALNINN